MSNDAHPPLLPGHAKGSRLGLSISRFDERHRRQRLRLPTQASCWDYASLLDVIYKEPGFDTYRFTGKTADQWIADLRHRSVPDQSRFLRWYESIVTRYLGELERRPRVPDNHYCVELAVPPLESSLPRLICDSGLKRASVRQWLATLKSLTTKGLKLEELLESGVLERLRATAAAATVTQAKILTMIDLSHVAPKLVCESRFGFVMKSGWKEKCQRIPEAEFKRRGLLGTGYGAQYLIRYQHRSLGWAVVHARYSDLLTERGDWWGVLDERGRFIQQSVPGFDSADNAMDFAEYRMSQRFAPWSKDQLLSKWERYSLPGGDGYREILLQLDDWPGNYTPRHYRTRNVLVHIRTSLRRTQDGRQVLFLDEIQSDWHADLHAKARTDPHQPRETAVPHAPFRTEWPLLSMKVMIWWAQRLGVEGLAWSSAELQSARWRDCRLPELLYQKLLPGAARSLAATLRLSLDQARLSVRANCRRVVLGRRGWQVCNREGVSLTKPFRIRAQAERFADLTGEFVAVNMPVLWIKELAPICSMPLYGIASPDAWLRPKTGSSGSDNSAHGKHRTSVTA
ncbi:hypothetical protein OKW30_002551 [Paraburkholderia sp. Clong3]|uniref:hypothetical protein n=1 Tax=Paraburkholderia sp. Clong3 TaxID=2991061 RepID=UPI003D25A8F8